jgi:hypothetical protein
VYGHTDSSHMQSTQYNGLSQKTRLKLAELIKTKIDESIKLHWTLAMRALLTA